MVNNSKDILELKKGDLIYKSDLYKTIVSSCDIRNSPQQGINWIQAGFITSAVIVKSKYGCYHQDNIDEYAFKARNGIVNKYEKANQVLINQPKYNYPILYFVEYGKMWQLLGRFKVNQIKDRSVSLLPFEKTNNGNISPFTDSKGTIEELEKTIVTSEITSKIEKAIKKTIIAQRSVLAVNGKCKFIKKDGSYILADDNGMENSSLPWAGNYVKVNIFDEKDGIIIDWNWEK